jgi:hypothetical protein
LKRFRIPFGVPPHISYFPRLGRAVLPADLDPITDVESTWHKQLFAIAPRGVLKSKQVSDRRLGHCVMLANPSVAWASVLSPETLATRLRSRASTAA